MISVNAPQSAKSIILVEIMTIAGNIFKIDIKQYSSIVLYVAYAPVNNQQLI